jgi:hypothetical protein
MHSFTLLQRNPFFYSSAMLNITYGCCFFIQRFERRNLVFVTKVSEFDVSKMREIVSNKIIEYDWSKFRYISKFELFF